MLGKVALSLQVFDPLSLQELGHGGSLVLVFGQRHFDELEGL